MCDYNSGAADCPRFNVNVFTVPMFFPSWPALISQTALVIDVEDLIVDVENVPAIR